MSDRNYYEILEIKRDSSNEEIANAYRRLSLKNHPKRGNPSEYAINNHTFHQIAEAYVVLIDPNKRGVYDVYGSEGLRNGITDRYGNIKGGFKYSGNAWQIFENFFGTANPFALIKDFDRIDDQYGTIFGSAFGGQFDKQSQPLDEIKIDLLCTLEELYKGTVKRLSYEKNTINLDGRTTSLKPAFVDVEVFKGYSNGKVIRFPGQGNETPGYLNGDLLVVIKEIPNQNFRRAGNDLIYVQNLTLQEALLSTPVILTTLDNRTLTISMDEIIAPQTVKEVKAEGMPIFEEELKITNILENEKRGSLYIRFNISFPQFIDPQSKDEITRLLDNAI